MKKTVTIKSNIASEINLIDLLDNVHLSPQNENNKEKQIEDYQMRMLEEFCSTSNLRKQNTIDDAQFASFFDKYEKPRQTTPNKLNNADLHIFDQNIGNNESNINNKNYKLIDDNKERFTNNVSAVNFVDNLTPRVLIPKLENKKEIDDAESVNEDLIEEVLFEQQLEKQFYTKAKSERCEIPHTSRIIKSAQESHKHEDLKHSLDILDEIITTNRVKHFNKPITKNINNTKDDIPNHYIPDNIESKEFASEKTKLQQKALTEELVTRYDIKYLEAVKKNDKAFRSSALKSDAEKLNLTVGPSLYEKSVVLPQIMQRIRERQKELEERSRLTMRLILGGSEKCNVNKNPLNVTGPDLKVLMTDCNKERLKACESAKLFNSYVRSGNFEK